MRSDDPPALMASLSTALMASTSAIALALGAPARVPMVAAGQRMIGGESVLADRLAQEPPRQGVAQ